MSGCVITRQSCVAQLGRAFELTNVSIYIDPASAPAALLNYIFSRGIAHYDVSTSFHYLIKELFVVAVVRLGERCTVHPRSF